MNPPPSLFILSPGWRLAIVPQGGGSGWLPGHSPAVLAAGFGDCAQGSVRNPGDPRPPASMTQQSIEDGCAHSWISSPRLGGAATRRYPRADCDTPRRSATTRRHPPGFLAYVRSACSLAAVRGSRPLSEMQEIRGRSIREPSNLLHADAPPSWISDHPAGGCGGPVPRPIGSRVTGRQLGRHRRARPAGTPHETMHAGANPSIRPTANRKIAPMIDTASPRLTKRETAARDR